MKVAVVLVVLSVAVMVVMIFQAVRQELSLRHLKTSMVENSAEVKRKEEAIIEVKNKIKDMKDALTSVNTKLDELKKKKAASETSAGELGKALQTCNTEKADVVKKKEDTASAITKLHDDHEVLKKKAEEDIQSLKQQILDRDKAICAFVDTTKEEARKLCGLPEVPK
ncbi:structural maintenance of chromosomes protein 1 [Morone saxatilis]|uniref:structural maintenance of chromosomes protein 1 n=1 Tax=Morone saxatilis TaxID=34816 RepID=UPI0015E1D447|nr:structural maintenance of chromosomes protein 1 [Morone saxatilis]